MINFNARYKTRNGKKVIITAIEDDNSYYPVKGKLFAIDDYWVALAWTETGEYLRDAEGPHHLDLIEETVYG